MWPVGRLAFCLSLTPGLFLLTGWHGSVNDAPGATRRMQDAAAALRLCMTSSNLMNLMNE